jgi:Transcription factor WhiB
VTAVLFSLSPTPEERDVDPQLAALMVGDCPSFADVLRRPAWMRDALCREYPELEFVPSARTIDPECVAVCRKCLVRIECCEYAIGRPSEVGCWGGSSDNQRVRGRLERLTAVELIERVDRPPGAHRFQR